MTVLDKIQQQFAQHTEYHFAAAEMLPHAIAHASEVLSQALLAGHKIMTCGNAGAGLFAQYLAAELLNRFDKERPALPALALTHDTALITSITHTYSYEQIFAKQIRSLGQEEDVLIVITTQQSKNLIQAITSAHERGMRVICLTGQHDIDLISLLNERDVGIAVPAETSAAILEIQLLIIHALLIALDYQLFGIEH